MIIFETARLCVRQLRLDDLPGFFEMQSNPNVMRYATGEVEQMSESTANLNRCIAAYEDKDNKFRIWAIETKSDQTFVGTCAIVADDAQDNEIGYRFLESMWGQGFGREICDGLIDYAINELKLPSLVANCDTRNIGSVKILEASKLQHMECENNPDCECDLVYRWKR